RDLHSQLRRQRQMCIRDRTNDVILRRFISEDLTDKRVQELSDEKEAYYRKSVLESPDHNDFTKGLVNVCLLYTS
ncbi:hypothetical protein KQJ29_35955, partial [Enterococcus sp. S181_ASV_20]|nr:hypothetical protein [Enterococcus sp. S181_ASV_20]